MENDRLDELYLPMGGLGGQKPQITPKNAKQLVFIKNENSLFFVPSYPLRVSTLPYRVLIRSFFQPLPTPLGVPVGDCETLGTQVL